MIILIFHILRGFCLDMSSSVEDEEGGSGSSSASLLTSPKNSKKFEKSHEIRPVASFQKPVQSSDDEDDIVNEKQNSENVRDSPEEVSQISAKNTPESNYRKNTNSSKSEVDLEKASLRADNKVSPNCVSTSNQTLEGRTESTEEDELIRFSDGFVK